MGRGDDDDDDDVFDIHTHKSKYNGRTSRDMFSNCIEYIIWEQKYNFLTIYQLESDIT